MITLKDQIPHEEVSFHPLSYADPNGRVFWWNGELYRGIRPFQKELYNDLFSKRRTSDFILNTRPILRVAGFNFARNDQSEICGVS